MMNHYSPSRGQSSTRESVQSTQAPARPFSRGLRERAETVENAASLLAGSLLGMGFLLALVEVSR